MLVGGAEVDWLGRQAAQQYELAIWGAMVVYKIHGVVQCSVLTSDCWWSLSSHIGGGCGSAWCLL